MSVEVRVGGICYSLDMLLYITFSLAKLIKLHKNYVLFICIMLK